MGGPRGRVAWPSRAGGVALVGGWDGPRERWRGPRGRAGRPSWAGGVALVGGRGGPRGRVAWPSWAGMVALVGGWRGPRGRVALVGGGGWPSWAGSGTAAGCMRVECRGLRRGRCGSGGVARPRGGGYGCENVQCGRRVWVGVQVACGETVEGRTRRPRKRDERGWPRYRRGGAEFDKAGGADTGLGSVWAMERERC